MNDPVLDRPSSGLLVHPFGDGAVVADLVGGRAHLVSTGAAWLLSSDPETVEASLTELPEDQRSEAWSRILDAFATLRTPGLVGRNEPLEERPRPVGSNHEPRGTHVGRSHPVLAERIAFRSDDPGLIEQIDTYLGSGLDESPSMYFDVVPDPEGGLDLFTENDWHFLDEEQFFFQLPAVFNDYAARSHDVIALHAGAVRTPDGRVLLLVGHMNAGKSTLTAALVAAGCDHVSDETVGIGRDLSLVGYPKPITLDLETHEVLGLTEEPEPHIAPERLRPGTQRLATAPRIDEILLVDYDAFAPGVEHDRLGPAEALEALCAHTLNLARMGKPGLATLCETAEKIPTFTCRHPGIDAVVPVLLAD